MGSVEESTYSVQRESRTLFEHEILENPLIPSLPADIKEASRYVHFSGNDLPSIPINWRFAESVSVMKAFEASMLNVLRARKYGTKYSDVDINTDHASLFIMTPFITQVVKPGGELQEISAFAPKVMVEHGFKSCDLHRASASLQRALATNIYKTKDGRFYHVHGKSLERPGWGPACMVLTYEREYES